MLVSSACDVDVAALLRSLTLAFTLILIERRRLWAKDGWTDKWIRMSSLMCRQSSKQMRHTEKWWRCEEGQRQPLHGSCSSAALLLLQRSIILGCIPTVSTEENDSDCAIRQRAQLHKQRQTDTTVVYLCPCPSRYDSIWGWLSSQSRRGRLHRGRVNEHSFRQCIFKSKCDYKLLCPSNLSSNSVLNWPTLSLSIFQQHTFLVCLFCFHIKQINYPSEILM